MIRKLNIVSPFPFCQRFPVIDIYAFELSRGHSPNGGKCQWFANKKGCTAKNKE